MINPVTRDLTVPRNAPLILTILVRNKELTDAVCAMQVRDLPDAPGDARIGLTMQTVGTQGISIDVVEGDSTITIQIDKATLQALPAPAVIGEDLPLWWDLTVDPTDSELAVWVRGLFIVQAGVTR